MRQFFSNEELRTIKIQEPFSFTKDIFRKLVGSFFVIMSQSV